MKQIEIIEKVLAKEIKFSDANINQTFFCAYRDSKDKNLETLDFHDVIWEHDIAPIIAHCKEYGIEEITISCTFTSFLEKLSEFLDRGCELAGVVKINSGFNELTNDFKVVEKMIPAMKIRMPR